VAAPLVTLERTDAAAIITLNRPERHNALVPELLQALAQALAADLARQAPAVVLAAAGRSFSTGGDLLGFWQHRQAIGDYAHHLVGLLNQALLAIYTHPAPVVCAVQGQVTGGALGFLLAADRVIMQRGVSVTPWYAAVGFSPDGGWTALLPRVIGRQPALDWIRGNATRRARDCKGMGLAHEISEGAAADAALAWAGRAAAMSAGSIAATRALLSADQDTVREALEAERTAFVRQVQTPEALAGMARFLGKDSS
jgi:2-(1,2-epoxy-1,2-dihydrophenyl)acetyl-CoA isomerase